METSNGEGWLVDERVGVVSFRREPTQDELRLHESYVIAMIATSAATAFATGLTPVACNFRPKNHPVLFAG